MAGAENKVTVQEKGDRPPWDMTWLPSLPALWESQRALRQRSISGKPLVTGIMSRRHGVEVCVGSMACVKLNHEVLKPITSAMAESACLQTPGLELLFHEVLAFHVSAGYPDEKQMAAVAHADAWGLKRMLNFLRRKWYKEETPRDAMVRDLVQDYQQAFNQLHADIGGALFEDCRQAAVEDEENAENEQDEILTVTSYESTLAPFDAEQMEEARVENARRPLPPPSGRATLGLDAGSPVAVEGNGQEHEGHPAAGGMEDLQTSHMVGEGEMEELQQKLRLAELKLEAKRLMAVEKERMRQLKRHQASLSTRKSLVIDLLDGAETEPISHQNLKNYEEETQLYIPDTQAIMDVMHDGPGLESPSGKFPLALQAKNAQNVKALDKPLVEVPMVSEQVSPLKRVVTREDQLAAKAARKRKSEDEEESCEKKKTKKAGRLANKQANLKKKTSKGKAADKTEDVKTSKKKTSKNKTDTPPAKQALEKKETPDKVANKNKGERSSSSGKGGVRSKTFAGRYKPTTTWMGNFWEAAVSSFGSIIKPRMESGSQTRLETQFWKFAKEFCSGHSTYADGSDCNGLCTQAAGEFWQSLTVPDVD
ncbi:unnamed protein product [Effrenium voratum]|uniref:Uncharacterized protein n=1 Tax=Effrenium voratum TaxID=2562239 RepID=A0AA36J1Z9_9DINO|nr:unnamed protein product [Effrenium voratum]